MGARGALYCGRCGRQVAPSGPCPRRCVMPDGNGTICLETGDLLPAGPCPADCVHHHAGSGERQCCRS